MKPDVNRTNWPAILLPHSAAGICYVKHRAYGRHGAFIDRNPLGPNDWTLCCPGCGQMTGPKTGATWTVEEGSFEEMTKLTLMPSIAAGCCGWHGFLIAGRFWSCTDGPGLQATKKAFAERKAARVR